MRRRVRKRGRRESRSASRRLCVGTALERSSRVLVPRTARDAGDQLVITSPHIPHVRLHSAARSPPGIRAATGNSREGDRRRLNSRSRCRRRRGRGRRRRARPLARDPPRTTARFPFHPRNRRRGRPGRMVRSWDHTVHRAQRPGRESRAESCRPPREAQGSHRRAAANRPRSRGRAGKAGDEAAPNPSTCPPGRRLEHPRCRSRPARGPRGREPASRERSGASWNRRRDDRTASQRDWTDRQDGLPRFGRDGNRDDREHRCNEARRRDPAGFGRRGRGNRGRGHTSLMSVISCCSELLASPKSMAVRGW